MSLKQREARLPLKDAPPEGSVLMLEVGGHRVGLYRVGDALHALADRCPHRGAPLCSGRIATPIDAGEEGLTIGPRKSIVRCPWHKWEFDIATGHCRADERLRVRRYAVRLEEGDVVITLDRAG